MRRLIILSLFFCTLSWNGLRAQCSTTIGSFPYVQDFEASNGNWVPGGTASEWSWGTPIKPVISGAASGSKCWITGTLTQSAYSKNQNSTLTSPCFDFSGLTNPYIKFKVFWETEKKYDGAGLQFSLDGGNNWSVLGTSAECPSDNWFNTASITASGKPGWSGNIQPTAPCAGGAGGGSGSWLLAQHNMSALAGKPSVRFRFTFAAGSVCNNYDGFAIDDIWIGQMPVSDGSFSYTCGASHSVSFSSNLSGCQLGYLWNFGDPASGTANTSTLSNPVHNFSGPGQYTVTVSYSGSVSAPPSSQQLNIIDVSAVEASGISCFGRSDGSAQASVLPSASYTYQWTTTPVQNTPLATGLGAGTYTVKVTGNNACPASASVTLAGPPPLQHQLTTKDPACGFANGTATILESGGSQPYQYVWTPAGSGSASTGLGPASYSVVVTDDNSCRDTVNFILKDQNNLNISLGNDTVICPGSQLILDPGKFSTYRWQDNSTLPTFKVLQTGDYSVRVVDSSGCSAADTVHVTVDCSDLYFPSGFTPNGDGNNDDFGALGNLDAVGDYTLRIYNRWGQIVFLTADPHKKWQGTVEGKAAGSTNFVWVAEYTIKARHQKMLRKGSVVLIR